MEQNTKEDIVILIVVIVGGLLGTFLALHII